jgi:hypothetical protein
MVVTVLSARVIVVGEVDYGQNVVSEKMEPYKGMKEEACSLFPILSHILGERDYIYVRM